MSCGYGRRGYAINLVTENQFFDLREFEKFYSTTINMLPENVNDLSDIPLSSPSHVSGILEVVFQKIPYSSS
jgi:hypothetical protein